MDDTPALSPEQTEALTLLATGLTIRQIARRLHVTAAAISMRVQRASRILGAKTTVHAVLLADRAGLLPGSPLPLFPLEKVAP